MPKKLSPELQAQIKQAARHPVVWWRGAGLPEEQIRPWEGGIQFFAELLKGFMNGFTSMKDRLFVGMGEGKIPPNLKSVHDVIRITWDGLNDPPVGMYMDRKRFGEKIHRWVMRFNATFSPIFILIQCLNLGLTPVRRVIMWTAITMFADLMSTANAVSETKIWAGISPHTQQRGALQMWRTLGDNVGALVSGLPLVMMGLAGTFGWELSDYSIMVVGAMLSAPVTIFSRWLPSFAKQRVDFTVRIDAEGEEPEENNGGASSAGAAGEKKLGIRESFRVVKHNTWFILWVVVDLIRVLGPRADKMLIYRFLVPNKSLFGGKPIDGLLLKNLSDVIFKWPALVLVPFAKKAVDKFGDPVKFVRAHTLLILVTQIAIYAVGYKTWPRLVIMWVLECLQEVMGKWRAVPDAMIRYEMFDYVEWKTGYRSEGITESVNGLLRKLLRDNMGSVVDNFVNQWTGYKGYDIPLAQQPRRFLDTLWPRLHLGPIFGEIVALIAVLRFKYPHDPKEVEADLIERRALAQKLKEEVEIS